MRKKNLIPVMSAVTGLLVLTTIALMFTIGPWKRSSDKKTLQSAEHKNSIETSVSDEPSSDVTDPVHSDPPTVTTDQTEMTPATEHSSEPLTETSPSESETTEPTSDTEATSESTPTPEPTATSEPTTTPEPTDRDPVPAGSYDLSGMVVVLDPGHQRKANYEQELVAPWSEETKDKVSAGTSGVATGRPEYEVVLEIALKMRDHLESMGATVIMTRTSNDVNISNIERANIATDNHADVFIRLHCDASDNSSTRGIGVFVCSRGELADNQVKWGDWLGNCMADATGSKYRGCNASTTYSGLNWSTSVPSFLLEMGFMSNEEDDRLLSDPEYQQRICNGAAAFCNKMKNR